MAINAAQQKVKETGDLSVPLSIRNAPTKLMKDLGYGSGYQYAHNHKDNFANAEFLPDKISGTSFFKLGNNPRENVMKDFLKKRWKDKYDF